MWQSATAQVAVATGRAFDPQFNNLTRFEFGWVRRSRMFYDAAALLSAADTAAWVAHVAAMLGIDPPVIRVTSRKNPYCMPYGAKPAIYLRADHRQPYYVAHEVAHAATRATRHPPKFIRHYQTALVALGADLDQIRRVMHGYQINF